MSLHTVQTTNGYTSVPPGAKAQAKLRQLLLYERYAWFRTSQPGSTKVNLQGRLCRVRSVCSPPCHLNAASRA